MIALDRDCPECRSAASVHHSVCEVCLAELDETPRAPLPHPAARPAPPGRPGEAIGAPAPVASLPPLRFVDVLAELTVVADLADGADPMVAQAARRAAALLRALRTQFVTDVAS